MNIAERYPNNLRDLRKNAGLRQCDVASKLGHASTDRISHWEKGLALPGAINLFKLSVIYGIPPERLYGTLYESVVQELRRGNLPDGSILGSSPLLVQSAYHKDEKPEQIEKTL